MTRTYRKVIYYVLSVGLICLSCGSFGQESQAVTTEVGVTFLNDGCICPPSNPDLPIVCPPHAPQCSTPPGKLPPGKGRLPQLNEQRSSLYSIIGIMCIALFFLIKKYRKKQSKEIETNEKINR